jgi:hypothetical protein
MYFFTGPIKHLLWILFCFSSVLKMLTHGKIVQHKVIYIFFGYPMSISIFLLLSFEETRAENACCDVANIIENWRKSSQTIQAAYCSIYYLLYGGAGFLLVLPRLTRDKCVSQLFVPSSLTGPSGHLYTSAS